MRLVEIAERLVTFEGFRLLFGPQENFYIQASLQGFKIGDEDGDRMFASNSIGSIGADFAPGPLITTQIASGMTASEFFILWLLEQL